MKQSYSAPIDSLFSKATFSDLQDIKRMLGINTSNSMNSSSNSSSRPSTPTSSTSHPKITHHKRKASGEVRKPTTSATSTPTTSTFPSDIKNHDACDACGGVGQFLCCDACPNAFHFTCVEPPMDAIDVANLRDDKWFCNECEHSKKISKGKHSRSTPRGLFQKLVDDLSTRNPKAYSLPTDIIHFFKGVASDKYGRYIDTTQTKHVKYKNGEMELPDHHQLKDRNGKYMQCYYCRKTALKNPMITCDYCTLHWHLDCLNPPLASAPHSTKKWRCPNHIENIVKLPRQQKDATTIHDDTSPACAYQNAIDLIIGDSFTESNTKLRSSKTTSSTPATPTAPVNLITCNKTGRVYRLPEKPFQIDFSDYIQRLTTTTTNNYHYQHTNKPNDTNHTSTTERRSSIPFTLISSSSASEVSTPPTAYASPITSRKSALPLSHRTTTTIKLLDNKKEIDAWLHNMAWFQAGGQLPAATEQTTASDDDDATESMMIDQQHSSNNNDKEITSSLFTSATSTEISPPSSPTPNQIATAPKVKRRKVDPTSTNIQCYSTMY